MKKQSILEDPDSDIEEEDKQKSFGKGLE